MVLLWCDLVYVVRGGVGGAHSENEGRATRRTGEWVGSALGALAALSA